MDLEQPAVPPLKAVFDGAKGFGLSDDEVWRAMDECLIEAGGAATIAEYVDDLSGALARGILAKQRRAVAGDDRSPSPAKPR